LTTPVLNQTGIRFPCGCGRATASPGYTGRAPVIFMSSFRRRLRSQPIGGLLFPGPGTQGRRKFLEEVVPLASLEDLARERAENPSRPRVEWDAEEVGAVRKNSREAVVVRLLSSGSRKFVDIREFYWAQDAGEYRPTKRGAVFDVSLLPEVASLLEEAGRRVAR